MIQQELQASELFALYREALSNLAAKRDELATYLAAASFDEAVELLIDMECCQTWHAWLEMSFLLVLFKGILRPEQVRLPGTPGV